MCGGRRSIDDMSPTDKLRLVVTIRHEPSPVLATRWGSVILDNSSFPTWPKCGHQHFPKWFVFFRCWCGGGGILAGGGAWERYEWLLRQKKVFVQEVAPFSKLSVHLTLKLMVWNLWKVPLYIFALSCGWSTRGRKRKWWLGTIIGWGILGYPE